MISDITVRTDDGKFIEVIGKTHHLALRQLKQAVEDIADKIEAEAKDRAPLGETGRLKEHPTERVHVSAGVVTSIAGEAEGFRSIRGAGGRFVAGKGGIGGDLVARVEIGLPSDPQHAIWVHEGTGIYGPRRTPIRPRTAPYLRFTIEGREFRRKFVRGQHPQPYLFEAYLFVNNTYVPARLALLRTEVRVTT